MGLIVGVGKTTIVNSSVDPVQVSPELTYIAVTVITALIGMEVLFCAKKEIAPSPFAGNPIRELLFVHW